MAEAVVSCVLGKITEAAYQEALFLYGVGDKVEWAKRELEWVSAFLKDADAKQNNDALVKKWVEEVKEVAYMIEDALDIYFVEMGGWRQKKLGCLPTNVNPKTLIARHKVGTEIDKIKARMDEIRVNKDNFGIMRLESSSAGPAKQPAVRPIFIPEIDKTEVIGFEDDIKNICKQLLDQSVSRCSVISIVGPGGLGKTTLATKVYKDDGVEHHFYSRIWVTVSQEFKIIDLLKKMLKMLLGEKALKEMLDKLRDINANDQQIVEELIVELHKSLSKKKYLIVLDDVWSSDLWTQLEVALPEDHNGSRVLITTRSIDIAKKPDAANKPYELPTLNEDESQRLFLKKAFPNQPANKHPNILLPLIKQFVQKCGGWPLALVVLGGYLSTKDPDYNTWNEILLKINWHIEGSQCLNIISTSYEDLPSHLKPCFMYIASFPEDYKINATTLIQLWIAEGFIQREPTRTMEDTAESYLEELVQRCMVQVSKRSWSSKIKSCHVHDILRELALGKAKEHNFLLVCSKSNATSASEINPSARRIALHKYHYTEFKTGSVSRNLRSLIIFGRYFIIQNKLKMVRVVHVQFDDVCEYTEDALKYFTTLRYFRCNMGFDWNFPICFWNNKMLRYFKQMKILAVGPPSSANLENLETLKGVVARAEWKVKLPHFPRIRKLGIAVDLDIHWEGLTNAMNQLKHLESLRVFKIDKEPQPCLTPAFKNYEQMHSLYLDWIWPSGVVIDSSLFPPHLVKLTLSWSSLEQDPMPELQKLHSLRVLRMLLGSYNGERLICSAGGFRCLQQLILKDLFSLVELKVEEGSMSKLNLLEISCCQLQEIPDCQFLTNLRELRLQDMSDEFCSRLKGEDQNKVKHIQSIIFE